MNPVSAEKWYTDHWLKWLKVSVSITLFCRGWLTYRWDSPIRGLLWNEEFLAPILKSWFNIDWGDYANQSDAAISSGLEFCGIILMVVAVLIWLPIGKRWLTLLLITPGIIILLLDAFARIVDSGFQLGMSIEKCLQWGTPVLLLLVLYKPQQKSAWVGFAKILAALTFIGHGLYAVGFHPVPWNYQSMTRDLLGFSEAGALWFLRIAGILDFLVAIAIFVPPVARYALVYMALWGSATALARVCSHLTTTDPWLFETLVRSSHWAVPALLFWIHRRR